MIIGKYYKGLERFEDIREIRKQVFGEELGYSDELNFDGLDEEALHAVVYLDAAYTEPAAVGRLIITEDGYKIGRIAVKREARKHGYGDFIVHMLVDKAFQAGAEKVIVGARPEAVMFYKKIGFVITTKGYMEAGTSHTVMVLHKQDLYKNCQNESSVQL